MAFVVFKDGVTTVTLRYVEAKTTGSFQYRRRIPLDLQQHYGGKPFFVRSLRRDPKQLAPEAGRITARLDAEWMALRSKTDGADPNRVVIPVVSDVESYFAPSHAFSVQRETGARPTILLSEALKLYLAHHPKGHLPKFSADNERIVSLVIARLGNLPLDAYTRQHAEELRDRMLSKNLTGSVRRRLNSITAIFNKARKEKQLQIGNPFEGLGIAQEHRDANKRDPFTTEELALIGTTCHRLNDDIRHIIALQMDTGARVAEIVGLRTDDLVLDHDVPHVRIRPFGSIRTLKTPASERDVPLVGNALWAATMALQARRNAKDGDVWLFPRYCSNVEIKATHASNTLNKWLRSVPGVSEHKTTHCFRHAMRDRLRAAQVPHDVQEAIGGWGSRTVGQGYGRGYPLHVLYCALLQIVKQEM